MKAIRDPLEKMSTYRQCYIKPESSTTESTRIEYDKLANKVVFSQKGHDFKFENNSSEFTGSLEECEDKCNENDGCGGFGRDPQINKCWMKNSNISDVIKEDNPTYDLYVKSPITGSVDFPSGSSPSGSATGIPTTSIPKKKHIKMAGDAQTIK